ncbi:LOW QUALITY PROTEIN: acetyl-coenzyme A synthetase, cytoplasmic-like [Uloborus diversus]|uniref:LOW QUALITY PROTEIN: acetyl-coenzyme A synthetase, cytoplasmic-like n=1 Tax=Uloborus diversus TaxID=327109 RepID=UPI00240A750E|nr:LOW QUALITY PROTEIN: acetyl-coenzyme A synthetase, cytoplasmic-like [Uloborus diversus]
MPDFPANNNNGEVAHTSKLKFQNLKIESMDDYNKLYKLSIENPEVFWRSIANEFAWKTEPTGNFYEYNFNPVKGPINIKWMANAETNICYNALDLNVENGLGNKIAYFWEGNDEDDRCSITYRQLLKQVCKFANVLKDKGVKKRDRVTIYMPMIIEAVVAMLACSRIGATHNVVFGGFSSESLAERMLDSKSSVLVTADGAWRGGKLINLKQLADGAVRQCHSNHLQVKCVVLRHVGEARNNNINGYHCSQRGKRITPELHVAWNSDVDSWWHEEMAVAPVTCEPEWVEAEHPLFILYTSGSTGKPKGVVHSTAGYMLYAATTFQLVFAHKSKDVYFCTADIGWITGHTYGVYGPLLQGATSVLFQGIPTYPDPGRYWAVIERYNVSKFYTAPTAIRTLMKYGDSYVKKYNLNSLEVLGSVGEPINPEAWQWYYRVVGGGNCAIVDTFWQSETGGHVITPLPGCTALKPGSATFPFFGVVPAILDDQGREIEGPGEGYLVFKKPWPGMMRSLFGSHERFSTTYFRKFPGYYCSGDGARRDKDGYYWITGRMDDMLNVSGHLLSTAEVESALVEHTACVESAAVSMPHSVKGECLYCFVVLSEGILPTPELVHELKQQVRSKIGTFASPDYIHFSPALPKTRSGKILRRILRKIAKDDKDLGDLSTVAEESIIQDLFLTRPAAIMT